MRKPKEETPRLIWDRICSMTWNCSMEHARAIRLLFTGKSYGRSYDISCNSDCRCPKSTLTPKVTTR